MSQTYTVTSKGKPVKLSGQIPDTGEKAPDFTAVSNTMSPVLFSSYAGKTCVLVSVPSLDTSICDLETRRFNQEATGLGNDVVILVISMDLPFAQKRWCGAAGVDKVTTLSDHRDASFGKAYGVLMEEKRLLARAVFIIDPQGIIRYVQIVPDIGKEPDYAAVLAAVRKTANGY